MNTLFKIWPDRWSIPRITESSRRVSFGNGSQRVMEIDTFKRRNAKVSQAESDCCWTDLGCLVLKDLYVAFTMYVNCITVHLYVYICMNTTIFFIFYHFHKVSIRINDWLMLTKIRFHDSNLTKMTFLAARVAGFSHSCTWPRPLTWLASVPGGVRPRQAVTSDEKNGPLVTVNNGWYNQKIVYNHIILLIYIWGKSWS